MINILKIAKRALKLAELIWVIQFHWIIFKTTQTYKAGVGKSAIKSVDKVSGKLTGLWSDLVRKNPTN